MANKVEFGISNLHIGTWTVAPDGTVTLGTPYHQEGAIGFTPDAGEGENNEFYADNIVYWSEYADGSISGAIEVAMFDDAVKTQFLGYAALTDGGLAKVKGATKPNVYVAFEVQGDEAARRVIYYNVRLGNITREYHTTEEQKAPVTESLNVTVVGDNKTGAMFAVYEVGDTGYGALFSAPSAPALSV